MDRQVSFEIERAEQRAAAESQQDAGKSTQQREQNAFCQQLLDQPLPRSPQRRPNRNFTFAHCRPHQHDIGDVHARQQENHRRQSEKQAGDNGHGIVGVGLRAGMDL